MLRKTLIAVAFRNTIRLTWAMQRAAETLNELSQRLEGHANQQAEARGIDVLGAIEPLITPSQPT